MIDTSAIRLPVKISRVNMMDRVSAVLVVVLTLAALLGGALLKNAVESRARAYKDPTMGVTLHYPEGWQLSTADADKGVLVVRDTSASEFPTTFEIHRTAVDSKASDMQALAMVANDLALNRGRELTAFKLFNVSPGSTVNGLPAAQTHFVYVGSTGTALQETTPAVVIGDDTLVRKGDKVYAFSFQSTQANRDRAQPLFDRFVSSAELP